LPETRLKADTRHFYATELCASVPITHVRLRIFPDGGVSRLRVWGERSAEPARPSSEAVERLNSMSEADAHQSLQRCCGSARWVEAMLAARPFESGADLLARAERAWRALRTEDYLEAFAHHPEIGADLGELRRRFASTATLAETEQAGTAGADEATLTALRAQNQAYQARFGYVFIVCASGKSAREMLGLLEARLHNPPELEIGVAAAEQSKITRLRLERIGA
jgi:OHCU decarboxylase